MGKAVAKVVFWAVRGAGGPTSPGNVCSVRRASARAARTGGLLAGGVAAATAVAATMGGCTSVTAGDPTVNASDAPAYRSSMAMSSSQAAASSRARESERQASMTAQALQNSCDTLYASSDEAIDAVNAYVDAYNGEGGDPAATEGPAVEALARSAQAVEESITDITPDELAEAFAGWSDGAYAAADAISGQASAEEFNAIIDDLNFSRSRALRLCDEAFR